MPTGDIEIKVEAVEVYSRAEMLPFQVAMEDDAPEELRLKYRFLDLRKERIHQNIMLRSKVIAAMRRLMVEQGFTEYQTPILTASSPEGARDFLVPSRINPGKFYALPQAPQQFKQLLMVAGLTSISRLRRVSAMKIRVLIVLPESSISWIWKCLLPHRKMFLKSLSMPWAVFLTNSAPERKLIRLRLCVFLSGRQC